MSHIDRDTHDIKAESHNEHGEVCTLTTPRVGARGRNGAFRKTNKWPRQRPGDWHRGGADSKQSHHALLHPRVARPQTHPPATSSDKRQRLKLERRPREAAPRPPSSGDTRGPSREQDKRGSSPGSQGRDWPALLLPPPHPGRTRSASPTRSKRPKMHQPITSSAAAAAIFASGPDRPEGEGKEGNGTERDPEPRSLKVKGVEGRSGGLPRRPGPRASPGDHPNRGRDVTTLPARGRLRLVASESLYPEWILCHWMFKWGLVASMTTQNEVLFPVSKQKSSWCRNESA